MTTYGTFFLLDKSTSSVCSMLSYCLQNVSTFAAQSSERLSTAVVHSLIPKKSRFSFMVRVLRSCTSSDNPAFSFFRRSISLEILFTRVHSASSCWSMFASLTSISSHVCESTTLFVSISTNFMDVSIISVSSEVNRVSTSLTFKSV